jgi:hypothetical protein
MEKYVGKYIYVSSKGFGGAEFIFKLEGIKECSMLCGDVVYIKCPILNSLYDGREYAHKVIGIKAVKTIREATREEIELLKH